MASPGVEGKPLYVKLVDGLKMMHVSRTRDAKATLYPAQYSVYNKSTGVYLGERSCARGMSQPIDKFCPENWHACRQQPCKAFLSEGHYCMPGPLDSFLRIVFSALAFP